MKYKSFLSLKSIFILTTLVFITITNDISAQKVRVATIGFYNLENLFDTINQADVNDDEFTPTGANQYTPERYLHKISQLSDVISQIGRDVDPKGLMLLGVSEIENRSVLEDLVNTAKLKPMNLGIVHFDGPDRRGVDVGLLYRSDLFKVLNARSVRLHVNEDTAFRTRDQLVVTGMFDNETIHVIVNHWPSRSGGEEKSAPKRYAAASLTRHIADSLYKLNPEAKIIIMGDLNDDPVNLSVTEHLGAVGKTGKLEKQGLFNPMWKMYKEGIGSLAYRDTWNLFDQIIVSEPLVNDRSGYRFLRAHVFNRPFLLQKEGSFKGYPWRTYVGKDFKGGYSDHLPTYIILVKEVK
ncbi:MAG TPA: endonuclease [Bacteroidales bacterium]|nr:MAG: endonuclease [Bacteroidetes bacterium GWE2_42_24]OFY28831.1 MAG: endonuclease [Bacteroidetes bacterium GWF2_43_11]PKP23437.1 MAG: endonuclease [Bacteroidetes bacterium HGW-Bacteroidetes-22]HAQ65870.1 endonuclease [Bacteroidales bacterium]HBZ67662.1 endonuclease [Bacteroidales bacterium]